MRKKPPPAATVPTNPEEWSETSKQSYIYQSPPSEYRDHHYECRRCKQPAVFSAEEQRQTYEVRKAYIWQKRNLCTDCFKARMSIESDLETYRKIWQEEKTQRITDLQFQKRWLELLQDHVQYGGNADEGNIQMLTRLLGGSDA